MLPVTTESHRGLLPNCLIIGPMRAGTTWIHRYLASRGDVVLPQGRKETYFFDSYYERGVRWYAQQFRAGQGHRRIVEVAPTYFHSPEAPQRVFKDLGRIKLVCTLRDPATRAFSHYLHLRRYGLTTLPFRQAVVQHPEILAASRYSLQLRRWVSLFGRGCVASVRMETLIADANQYARQLCSFLDLPFEELDPALRRPVNQIASLPRFAALARLGYRASHFAHALGLHGLVRCGTALGLKRLFFGIPGAVALPELSDEDRRWLLLQLGQEFEDLAATGGIEPAAWRLRLQDDDFSP